MNSKVALFVALTCLTKPLRSLPELDFPDCHSLTSYGETICSDETNQWCQWSSEYSVCQPTTKVHLDAIFIDWYDNAINCTWIILLPTLYVLLFILARWICTILLQKELIQQSYFEKCCIYIFEIICGIPLWIKILSPTFIYDMAFNPDKYTTMTPKEFKEMYGSIAFVTSSICIIYMVQLAYARSMRWQLIAHHWISIVTITWMMIAFNERASLDLGRVAISMTFYTTLEQHVFVQLLLYRMFPSRFPALQYLSSYCYVLSRVFTLVLVFVCYAGWAEDRASFIFSNNFSDVGPAYYLLFFYVPIANVLLNVVQIMSMKALFSMSERVYENSKLRSQLSAHPRLQQLYDIFVSYDDDASDGSVSRATEWSAQHFDQFLQDYCEFYSKNSKIAQVMFDSLVLIQEKQNYMKKLSAKQKNRVRGIRWKTFLYLFKTELLYVSEDLDTKHIVSEKLDLLVSGAFNQMNAVRNKPKPPTKTAAVLKKQGKLEEANQVNEAYLIEAALLLSESIENLNSNAATLILNVSLGDDKKHVLDRMESMLADIRAHRYCSVLQFCFLFILRCVPCRFGCKTKYYLADAEKNRKDIELHARVGSMSEHLELANAIVGTTTATVSGQNTNACGSDAGSPVPIQVDINGDNAENGDNGVKSDVIDAQMQQQYFKRLSSVKDHL